jgi:hypothetical protein
MGAAVPLNVIGRIVPRFEVGGHVVRGYIGSQAQPIMAAPAWFGVVKPRWHQVAVAGTFAAAF